MEVNAVILAGVYTNCVLTRSNFITKISTNFISAINDTIKKSYM